MARSSRHFFRHSHVQCHSSLVCSSRRCGFRENTGRSGSRWALSRCSISFVFPCSVSVASVIAVLYVESFQGYSRGVFAFDAILAPMFIVSVRLGLGAVDEYLRLHRGRGRRALIYGAGQGGGLVVREIIQNAGAGPEADWIHRR